MRAIERGRADLTTAMVATYHGPMTAFDASVFAQRRADAAQLVRRGGLGGFIIGTGPELAYLTGSWTTSHERLTALIIPPSGQARLLAPATDSGSFERIDVPVTTWKDGDDPYRMAAQLVDDAPVGLGSSLTADHVFALQAVLDQTVLASEAVAELFMVKDAVEAEQLARAGAAIDRVHDRVAGLLVPGRTEREVAQALELLILEEHERVEFIIVGSGPNGSNPHHDFSDRVLQPGDPVVVDLGGALDTGYQSDCTRTHIVPGDSAPADFAEAARVLEEAFSAACAAARPGITAGQLDAAARGVIERAGYGELFTHRLGHGIGLAGHEAPFIIGGSDVVLQEGMVFSIEPGLYKPGEWGMRIENIVRLSADGAQTLNSTEWRILP